MQALFKPFDGQVSAMRTDVGSQGSPCRVLSAIEASNLQ